MIDVELCYLSATEALRRFKEKSLSPVELLRALIERADQVEPTINAFSSERFDIAMKQARLAEEKYASADTSIRPLEGIPIVLKNEASMEGENTTNGSVILKDNIDKHNHPMTQRILDAGGIIHARGNVPEFCMSVTTHSKLHGITRNPWNTECTSGGSSGGSASSLASGTTTLATGSDIAGSIRVPASFCGVVGLKPSYGRVPEDVAGLNLDVYNHNGPMARTVADCALLFDQINGPHPSDIATIRPKLEVPTEFGDIRGMRIGVSIDLGMFNVDSEIEENTYAFISRLKELGATVEEVELGWETKRVRHAAETHLAFLAGKEVALHFGNQVDLMTAYAAELVQLSNLYTHEDYLSSLITECEMYQLLGGVLTNYDALVCPTISKTSFPADGFEPPFGGLYLDHIMTYPFNMMSRCPVLSMPSGFASNGVPTGVQIVGRTFEDNQVLKIGASIEASFNETTKRPVF